MSAKMWAGRFSKEVDEGVNAFNSSISFDCRMYRQDIRGSIAHATMLGQCNIIPLEDSKEIIKGLEGILADLDSGALEIDMSAEDIHMFIEAELTKRLGALGKKLHTSRSRNDQVALDIRLYLEQEIIEIKELVITLCTSLIEMAKKHTQTVMCGYTHLQRAQPITFAHHLMAYTQMLLRDIDRLCDCRKRMMSACPLGSCALAGTTYEIDRHFTAAALGFDGPCENSLDGVSDRDFCVELGCALSLIMTHLSRFSEEVIMWCSWEFKFIELDDAFATGSSIMPQKKNPDITELIRGKTGRVNGDLVTLLTMLKGLPLAYNKDMQEDKEAIFDAVDNTKLCLKTFIPMLDTMRVIADNMKKAASRGFINATDCADYLTKKGMPFREAYKLTGSLVADCISKGIGLEDVPLEDYKSLSDLFDNDIYDAIDLSSCTMKRKSYGGPAPECVKVQIEDACKILEKYKA
ncbi:MAG: argininosuccinate lyase [Oscillospiraceae bacterium]|nr:argininosuccinate lyase [Oscillospiraceae bacterium]